MTSAAATSPGVGRQRVVLRARPTVRITPVLHAGRRAYVAKDPVSLAYFHLDERQHFLFARLDGRRTLEEIRREYEQAFKPQRLTSDELEAFASQLVQSG